VLLLTGADSAQFVVDGLGAGADDFVTKGSDLEILLARLRALLRVKAYQDQLRKLNDQITRDLQIARRVQEALVPQRAFNTHRLGAMPRMTFDERCTTVAPGDTLFVYTDGLTDRRTAAGEFYSIDRIAALLQAAPDADLTALYDSIYADVSGFPSTDDFKDDI